MLRRLAPAMVMLVAIVVNVNILDNGFVYDDGSQILHNAWLRDSNIAPMFTRNVWGFMGPRGTSNYYRPLMHLVNLVCYRLFEFNARGYHALSLLVHVGCTVLVLLIGRRLGFSETIAFWGALLFALHPIHTEAVAWIAANTELIYTFLVLLAFFLYLKGQRRWPVAIFFLAMLMKETAIVFVPMIAAWELYEHRGEEWKLRFSGVAQSLAPYAIPLGIYFPMRINALNGMTMVSNAFVLSWEQQFYTTFALLGQYLWKLLDPLPFDIFYVFHETVSPTPAFWEGLAGVAAVIALAAWLWRRESRLWLAPCLILLPLAPVMWIQHVGENVFTERYLYLPSVGFCWLVAALIDRTPRSIAYVPVAGLLGGLLASWYAVTTFTRNYDWHDDLTLYEKTLIVSPEASLIRGNLANAYLLGDQGARALPLFRRLARDKPLDATYQVNLGTALARMGHFDEARTAFERARRLRPELPAPWANLGLIEEMDGHRDEAEKDYREALKRDPVNVDAHQNLGALLAGKGEFDEAALHFRAAASLGSLGKLLVSIGRLGEAEQTLRSVLREDVNNAEALYLLGNILRDEGREKEAELAFHEMRRVLPYTKWRPPGESVSGVQVMVSH